MIVKQSKRNVQILIFCLITFLFANFAIIIISGTSLSLMKIGDGDLSDLKHFETSGNNLFKHLRVDSRSNNSRYGITKFSKPNEKQNKFFFEDTENDVKHLYSNKFGSTEYFCSGSCFCDEDQERRKPFSGSIPIIKGILFLVSSISIITATEKASIFFQTDCEKRFDNACRIGSVRSEVDECISIDDLSEENIRSIDEDEEITKFQCSGYCSYIDFTERRNYVIDNDGFWENGDYSYIQGEEQRDNKIFIALENLNKIGMSNCPQHELTSTVSVRRVGSFENQEEMALSKFTSVHLHKFCKDSSFYTFEEISELVYPIKGVFHVVYDRALDEFDMKVVENYMKNSNSNDGLSICRARRYEVDVLNSHLQYFHVVCLRQFTSSEWSNGVPYEPNNLRHWKNGYKRNPEKRIYYEEE